MKSEQHQCACGIKQRGDANALLGSFALISVAVT